MDAAPSDKPVALTVNQLRALLDEVVAAGGGDHPVMLPYDPGHATLGGRAMQPLIAVDRGFDWEANRLLLRLPQTLSVQDVQLRQRLDRQANALMKLGLATRKLDEDSVFPLDEQVKQFKRIAEEFIQTGLKEPASPKAKPASKTP